MGNYAQMWDGSRRKKTPLILIYELIPLGNLSSTSKGGNFTGRINK